MVWHGVRGVALHNIEAQLALFASSFAPHMAFSRRREHRSNHKVPICVVTLHVPQSFSMRCDMEGKMGILAHRMTHCDITVQTATTLARCAHWVATRP